MKNNMEIINGILLLLMKLLFIYNYFVAFEELKILVRKILLLVAVMLNCMILGLELGVSGGVCYIGGGWLACLIQVIGLLRVRSRLFLLIVTSTSGTIQLYN